MGEWQKTSCVLCGQNCGLEMLVEKNRIVKVRPDKDNQRSEGYVCRKGLNVAFHQHHDQRLTHPLKRTAGGFKEISWPEALDEIAAKLRSIIDRHGPRSLAYMGGGGLGCHFEAAFGVRLLRGLGSRYHYSPLAQELTGMYWVNGRVAGRQHLALIAEEQDTDMLVAVGWNGWMSHQMPQARRVLNRISKDPDKLLVAIDPRRSETAQRADIHLALRPGSDALLARAMIAIILQKGWHNQDYIARHVSGFEEIEPWFAGFDARAAVEVCRLDYSQGQEVCRLLATRKWSLHTDLGILMNRHSTATSYLWLILPALCGRIGAAGGIVFPGCLMPMGSHSDERNDRTWRTAATDFPAILGTFPPNVMPEEILSQHPERLRAVLVSSSNPLRSFADTTPYEEAFGQLELLVTSEVAMTETAALSHYVLPARSAYESWDGTFFAWTWPGVYFQMRRPLIEPAGEPLEVGQIYTLLAERLGLIPPIPDELHKAAQEDHLVFGQKLMAYAQSKPEVMGNLPFVLAKTLGEAMGSANLAALWGILMTAPKKFRQGAVRAGFEAGPALGEEIFKAILSRPQGLWIAQSDPANNLDELRTEDSRLNLFIPEMASWVQAIEPASEAAALKGDHRYPLVLNAGRHMDMNANTLMRDPAWNKRRRACTAAMSPEDAEALNLGDGQMVRLTTEAGSVEIELEVSGEVRPGMVLVPHGFGLDYNKKVYGVNVNQLTKNTHRDRLAATPLHRHIPCRVEEC